MSRRVRVNNPRYPHTVKVVRITYPDRWSDEEPTETVLYSGEGRCYTNGSVEGKKVDISHRYISIPVRFDQWRGVKPMAGDTVSVEMGAITETMEIEDFEPDNNRSVLYCKRNGNFDE